MLGQMMPKSIQKTNNYVTCSTAVSKLTEHYLGRKLTLVEELHHELQLLQEEYAGQEINDKISQHQVLFSNKKRKTISVTQFSEIVEVK